ITTSENQMLSVRARGDQCNGPPQMTVMVDGQTALLQQVSSSDWNDYSAATAIPPGTHTISISFDNDFVSSGCDRNLRLDRVKLTAVQPPSTPPPNGPGFEAESMSLPPGLGQPFSDSSASGGQGLLIWTNGTAAKGFTTSGAQGITVRARGDQCN